MKRVMNFLLSIMLTMTLMPVSQVSTAVQAQSEPEILYGDANNDQTVNLDDVNLMTRYTAGETDAINSINFVSADVNADGLVDATDIGMVKQYLVGNIVLKPDLRTISFDTDGADPIPSVKTGRGYTYKGTIPTPGKKGYVFVQWVKEDGSIYYQAQDLINTDMKLTAVYEEMALQQELQITTFSLTNQPTNVSFDVTGNYTSAADVEANIKLVPKDGSDPVAVKAEDNGEGGFRIYAPSGFKAGATYELTLGTGLDFTGKDTMFRTCSFIIAKKENDNLKFNSDVIFIQDTDAMKYTVNGSTFDVLQSDLLSSNVENKAITGTFTMPNGTLKVGDVVCIYQTTNPKDRDYTKQTYDNDASAYVRITSVSGDTFGFESINESDASQVLEMPESILYQVKVLPVTDGTVKKSDYDINARIQLGITAEPKFNVNDFLVFYTGSFDEAKKGTTAVYGQILAVNGDEVSYKLVNKEDIENFMGMFVKQDVDAAKVVNDLQASKEALASVETQVNESGFAGMAAESMAKSAMNTPEVQARMRENGVSEEDIQGLAAGSNPILGEGDSSGDSKRTTVKVDKITVVPTFELGTHFTDGVGLNLEVEVVISINTKINATTQSDLKIVLSAGFEEEVSFNLDVDVDDQWNWYGPIPVLEDLNVNASLDIENYSSVSVCATIYTISEDIKQEWNDIEENAMGIKAPASVKEAIRKANKLGAKKKKAQAEGALEDKALTDEIKKLLATSVTVDGKTYSLQQIKDKLKGEDISQSFNDVWSAKTKDTSKTGMEELMDRYKKMLGQESDWVQLLNKEIFAKEFHIKVVAIKVSMNFLIKANVNLAIGADVEYEVGKRYSFWIHIMDKTSGSSETDLIDERFGFQFYVMGTLGLKFGIKAEVAIGLITTRIGSIGANVEFGPYLRLWGYFVYYYEKLRPKNTDEWTESEEMQGALYLEFGLYVTVKFKAQALENLYTYQPTLYNKEFPLLTAGVKQNVYDFALHPTSTDILYIDDADDNATNGVKMSLPQKYQEMRTMSMTSGEKKNVVYPRDKFIVTFDDERFTVDSKGNILVKPGEERYLKANMHIVWKCDKIAFSKYDIDITVPVVWTNMTDQERSEKFTASVMVGSEGAGYTKVWSGSYGRTDTFDLPAKDEILKLINYDSYNTDAGNVKYSSVGGYQTKAEGLKITADTVYYFDVTPRQYTLSVSNIENEDGTADSRTFSTLYGEAFDFEDLKMTGTNDAVTPKYSSFDHLEYADGTYVDEKAIVDLKYIQEHGNAAKLKAVYTDDTLTAAFHFVGIGDVPDLVVKFKRGTSPSAAGIDEVAQANQAMIESISPDPSAKVDSSISYTVNCFPSAPAPTHTLHFDTQQGSAVTDRIISEGGIILKPTDPVRSGYSFVGWYTDAACTAAFDFNGTRMPKNDLTLYAKWTANTYKITFEVNNSNITTSVGSRSITYDQAYGDLPVLSDSANKFLGWFTARTEGDQVTSTSRYTRADDQSLYAHWTGKATVDTNWITPAAGQSYTYDGTAHPFTFTVPDHEALKANMIVTYKSQAAGAAWTSDVPLNAGTYDVKITRPVDNDYLAMAEYTKNSAVVINKANMYTDMSRTGYEHWLPNTVSYTIGGTIVTQRPKEIKGDGAVTYELLKDGSTSIETNTSGVFKEIAAGSYVVVVRVAEGTNYLSTRTYAPGFAVSGYLSGDFTAYLVFHTTDGTDNDVYGGVYGTGYNSLARVLLNSSSNDLEADNTDTYAILSNIVPWQIRGGYADDVTQHGFNPAWSFTADLKIANATTTAIKTGLFSGTEVQAGADRMEGYEIRGYNEFKRTLTGYGNFLTGGADTIDLRSSLSTAYSYTYDGMVTDEKFMGTYSAMSYYGAPWFSVTSGDPVFDSFISYNGITSFTIDKQGLYDYLLATKKDAPTYTVALAFPHYTTTNEDVAGAEKDATNHFYVHKSITVTVPDSLKSAASAPSNGQALFSAYHMNLTSASSADATMKLSAADDILSRGKLIDVNVSIDEDVPVWGIFNEITFDPAILELLGTSTGSMFADEQYTLQNDLTKSSFKCLATLDELKTTSSKGTFITLHFRVRDDAQIADTEVAFKTVEASDKNSPLNFAKGDSAILTALKTPSTDSANTGDGSQVPLWAGLFFGSMLAGALLYLYRRRRMS